MLCLIVLSSCFAFALGSGMGHCPELKDEKAFNVDRFIGTWYILADTAYGGSDAKCGKFFFNKISTDDMNVTHTYSQATREYSYFGNLKTISPSKRIFEYDNAGYKLHYWIVGTDYESWAILYACSETGFFHRVTGFLLAKQNSDKCLSMEQKYVIKNILSHISGFSIRRFSYHNQRECQ